MEYLRGCWNLKKGIKTAPSVLREDPLLLRTVRCRLALRRRESFEYLCLYAFDLSQAFDMIFLFRERIRSLELTLYYLITGPHSRIGSVPKIQSGFTRVCGDRGLGEMRKTADFRASYRRIPGTLLFPQSGKFFIFLRDFRECGHEKS